MVNVYGDAKKNYKSAELLMLSATKAYLCCAFMDWAGMPTLNAVPSNIKLPPAESRQEEREEFITNTIGRFVEEYVLVECNVQQAWREQQEQKRQQRCHAGHAEMHAPHPAAHQPSSACTSSSSNDSCRFKPGMYTVIFLTQLNSRVPFSMFLHESILICITKAPVRC